MLLQNDTQVKSQKDWCNRKLTSTIKKKKKKKENTSVSFSSSQSLLTLTLSFD